MPTQNESLQVVVLVSAAMMLIFVAGQIIITPRTYAITSASRAVSIARIAPASIESQAQGMAFLRETPALEISIARQIKLYGDTVELDLADWPILGDPSAPNVLAAMLDFTCCECHQLHQLLAQAIKHYAGRLAIAIVPVPTHTDCNPLITSKKFNQAYACEFARLAWAVWLADPGAYLKWEAFLLESPEPQPFGLALIKAKELANLNGFNARESDAALDARIAHGVNICKVTETQKVPSVLLANGILHGHVKDLVALERLLEPHLKGNGVALTA
jgi:hypothetical protein